MSDQRNRLEGGAALRAAAKSARADYAELVATNSESKRTELAQQIETTLDKVRSELLALVTKVQQQQPTALKRDLYRLRTSASEQIGTPEVLLDVETPAATTVALGEILFSRPSDSGGVHVAVAGGLAGSGAQPRVNPYPADVDLGESLRIIASDAEHAAAALVTEIQSALARAREPGTNQAPVLFLGMMVGVYPAGHTSAGRRVFWDPKDVELGYIDMDTPTGQIRYYLRTAFSEPGGRIANTYWRGRIDADGTWGEITKVMTYRAFHDGSDAELFATPNTGQDLQSVWFAMPTWSDNNRVGLIGALEPQIANYLDGAHALPLKANKRAYTVARMFDDIDSLNAIAPLLRSETARLAQLEEHVNNFVMEIVAADGLATTFVSASYAHSLGDALATRVGEENFDLGQAMQRILGSAPTDVRGNSSTASQLVSEVLRPLEDRLADDSAYKARTRKTLVQTGYLEVAAAPRVAAAALPPIPAAKAKAVSTKASASHDAWVAGELATAKDGYKRQLGADPQDWQAAFQDAWIDAAFAPVDPTHLAALDRASLPAPARRRLALLRSAVACPLTGRLEEWNIAALRRDADADKPTYWLRRAAQAERARQYGLAQACMGEAERLEPSLQDHPTNTGQRIYAQLRRHLDELAAT